MDDFSLKKNDCKMYQQAKSCALNSTNQKKRVTLTPNQLLNIHKTILEKEELNCNEVKELRVRGSSSKQQKKIFDFDEKNKWCLSTLNSHDAKTRTNSKDNCQLSVDCHEACINLSSKDTATPNQKVAVSLIRETIPECNKVNISENKVPLCGRSISNYPATNNLQHEKEDVDFFKMICIDADTSQINFENNFPILNQQVFKEKIVHNSRQLSSTNTSEKNAHSKWNLKPLSRVELKSEHSKQANQRSITHKPASNVLEHLDINADDFLENDTFKSLLEDNITKNNSNKIESKIDESPVIFSSSSDSDPRRCSSRLKLKSDAEHLNQINQNISKYTSDKLNSAKPSLQSKININTSSQTAEKTLQSQFSQLFKSTQVIKQLEETVLHEEEIKKNQKLLQASSTDEKNLNMNLQNLNKEQKNDNFKLPLSTSNIINYKRKNLESSNANLKILKTRTLENKENELNFNCNKSSTQQHEGITDNEIEYRMTQLLKTSQYRKHISDLFGKMEQSVRLLHSTQEPSHSKRKTTDADWADDSFMADVLLAGITQNETGSINDVIKRTLKENAKKVVEQKTLVNRTLINTQARFQDLGPFFGLPNKVKELIQLYKGIDSLYDWQNECLNLAAVKERKNLIYSLPTSGGKTLVAEVLILREIICRKRNVIFVLPYVAIVQEKVWALSPFAVALDFLVEEYAAGKGLYPPKKRRYKNSVYIATTEKALGLINSLVELGRLEELGLVIVDELHLIGDEQRGPTLEALLTKLVYLNVGIQIVGMSATIGNLSDIQQFLKAVVYTRNFRPVELTEHIKCGNQIAKIHWNASQDQVFELVRTVDFGYSEAVMKIDPDHLGGLVMEIVPKESCLIFCSSKRSCENVTRLLCKIVFPKLKTYKPTEKSQLIKALKNESGTLCGILEVSIPFGIAYHHSGLTSEERKLIEEAYRGGIVSIICCTSTLAAGVNLPAKRVIIRKPFIANDFISLSRYKQMVGRAGRAGFGEKGESILICERKDLSRVKELMTSPMDQTLSKMHENESSCLRHLFLSCISLGTANTKAQLEKVASMTLLAVQQNILGVDMKKLTREVISDLFVLGAVQTLKDFEKSDKLSPCLGNVSVCMNSSITTAPMKSASSIDEVQNSSGENKFKRRIVLEANDKLVVSKLGCAAIKGCLELRKAHMLYEDLQRAQECLVLIDCLHLLYLVTPYNMVEQIKFEKNHCYTIMTKLGDKERKTAMVLGITDFCIMNLYSNQTVKGVKERVLNRFYMSLMLYDLWNEIPVIEVSEKYQINRGIVQNLMTNAASFASNVVNFCEQLEEFWAFAHLLKGMSQRLDHCCRRELLPLMELPAVKQSRARQLYDAGFKNLQSIAKAEANDLVQTVEFMSRRLAHQLIAAAQLLLLEKVETLREEAEDVLDGVEDPKLQFNNTFFK